MAAHGDLQGRDEVGGGEGLDHVGHGTGLAGTLDELCLAEGGQHDHRAVVLVENALGGRDAVGDGHLDVHDADVGPVLLGETDGLLAVGGLGDDLVPGISEGLHDVKTDEGLVLGDEDPAGSGGGIGAHAAILVCW